MIDGSSGAQESIFRFCKSLKAELLPPQACLAADPKGCPQELPGT